METTKNAGGRPALPDETRRKKSRAISLSDAQYERLQADAKASKQNVSAYVIKKLRLGEA